MSEKCKNCGADLEAESEFCHECGEKINPSKQTDKIFCTNCGSEITPGKSFCRKCGQNVNNPQNDKPSKLENKTTILVLIAIIAIIAIIGIVIINGQTSSGQLVNVAGYDFKIPSNYKFDKEASEKEIEGVDSSKIIQKVWTDNDNSINITVFNYDDGPDAETVLSHVGGHKEDMYGIHGRHYKFEDGGEAFAYGDGNKIISIVVSDASLFDKIEVL